MLKHWKFVKMQKLYATLLERCIINLITMSCGTATS